MRRAALAALASTLLLAGCGGDDPKPRASVEWKGDPVVVRQAELPDDTIVSGRVTNRTGRVLKLDVRDVKIVDGRGRAVRSTARFKSGITHSLHPPRDAPREAAPDFLRRRLGEVASVKPGESTELVLSWRVGPGDDPPVKVKLGGGVSLALPPEAAGPGT